MQQWFVYLLTCSDGTLYCGATTNIEKRVKKHNAGAGAKYTKTRLPVSLFKFWTFINKSDALKREYAIKQLSRDEKLAL